MKNRIIAVGTLLMAALAGSAAAQPTLTSLGTGTPLSLSNPVSGTYYIGGSGGFGTTNGNRWAVNGASITNVNAGTPTSSGKLSYDGAFMTTQILNGPTRFAIGNTATGVSPAFLAPGYAVPTLTPSATQPAATEFGGARWSAATNTLQNMGVPGIIPHAATVTGLAGLGNSGVFGVGSSGGSTSNFLTMHSISPNGRFGVGLCYVSAYNQGSTAGTSISSNSFYWRPVVWDADANAGAGQLTVLPTPFRTSTTPGNNTRRRTGNAYAVSDSGLIVLGAQEHNVGTSTVADPDGGRPVVWRLDTGTGTWGMEYLPNGKAFTRALETDVPALVGPITTSSTPSDYKMNAAGTLIVGPAINDSITTAGVTTGGGSFIGKWTWNAGTSSWDGPVNIISTSMAAASWLPASVTSCGVPPIITVGGMSEDGLIIGGAARYSTCGSFMNGGWIWTDPSVVGGTGGAMIDWYDYLVSIGVPGVTDNYGPTGDNGDPTRGLPKLGQISAISPDGQLIAGFQGGNQIIPTAVPWVLRPASLSACVAPSIITNPAPTVVTSRCTSSVILNVSANGSLPITYQWSKDGQPLVDGPTGSGSTVSGANNRQLFVNLPRATDSGTYTCVATGACGTPVQFTSTVVSADPAVTTVPNDTCATALAVGEGTFNWNLCGTQIDDTVAGVPSCATTLTVGDVWYTYTPTFTGFVRIETCGSNFDSLVSAYDACGGSELACNDNYETGTATGCTSTRSRVARLAVTAGTPVTIRIALKGTSISSFSSTGQVRILQAPAAAAGDLCDAPIPAVVGANLFDTTEASSSGDIVSCNLTNAVTRDVWFSYTPPFSGTVRAATCPGTTWDTVLSVHTSCASGDVACSDNVAAGVCVAGTSNQSVIAGFPVTGGQQYLFRVGGRTLSNFGAGTFTLAYSPTPCGLSDVAGAGQSIGASGELTADDIIVFLNWFFAGDNRANIAGPGQSTTPDAEFSADDIIVFLNRFFEGC